MTAPRAFLGRGWAFPVAVDDTGAVRAAVEDEDVRQAVHIILFTAPGERVMRPDFGAGLDEFVFEPLNTTTLSLIRHRVEQSLVRWEPRIDLREVRVRVADAPAGRLAIEVDCVVRETNTFYNLVYPFYLIEGERS